MAEKALQALSPQKNSNSCQARHDFGGILVFSPGMRDGTNIVSNRRWRLLLHSLSGRILLLTIIYVMASVALVYFPAVARYHHQLLTDRVTAAELTILPFTEAPGAQLSQQLRQQLMARAEVLAVVLRGGGQHELIPIGQPPPLIQAVYNAGDTGFIEELRDVLRCLAAPPGRIIRIDAVTGLPQGPSIFVVVNEEPIRAALITFSVRALLISIFVAGATGLLIFMSLYLILVRPMKRMTAAMITFRANPEDAARILEPSGRKDEIGVAEFELSTMQREIYGSLQQKNRLALLGSAVAKIQHDLRNILASAQIASDRLATSDDPVVKHVAPRLVAALDRAVALATNTLRYGKAEEPSPKRRRILLAPLIEEVAASALPDRTKLKFQNLVPPDLEVDVDPDQLFRLLLNLVKNAGEALDFLPEDERPQGKHLAVEARRKGDSVAIIVRDNGPGIAQHLRERLFLPFAGSAHSGGTGLGLAIARELARAHGGDITLLESDEGGTRFRVVIPDRKDD